MTNCNKLLIKNYLVGRTLIDLEREFCVVSSACSKLRKVSLNYEQFAEPNSVSNQCRGLIILPQWQHEPLEDNFKRIKIKNVSIVARPLDRFFNHEELNKAAKINWNCSQLRTYEKLDGTMCVLYFDERWCIGTRSVPEADLPIQGSMHAKNHTFSSLFKFALMKTLNECFYKNYNDVDESFEFITSFLDKNKTYIFELTSPMNIIFVEYNEYRATLLAVRDTVSGAEENIDMVSIPYLLKCPSWANLNTLDKLSDFINDADPKALEGSVVVDGNFRRIKVKNKQYVFSSKAKSLISASKRKTLKFILSENFDDILPNLDLLTISEIKKLQKALIEYSISVEKKINLLKTKVNSRKEYAKQVKKIAFTTPYFALYNENIVENGLTFMNWLKNQNSINIIDQILKIIDYE